MAKLKPNLDFALPASAREFAEGSAEDGTTKTTAKGEVTVKAGKKARKAQIGARVSRELFNQLPLVAANLSIKLGRRVTVQEAVEMALQEYVDEVMGEKKQ